MLDEYTLFIVKAIENLRDHALITAEHFDKDTRGHFLGTMPNHTDDMDLLRKSLECQINQTKACSTSAEHLIEKRKVKAMRQACDEFIAELQEIITAIDEYKWLTEKFGEEGKYQNIAGLCKIATIDEIGEKNYSLTPGAYVGVAVAEDDGVDFHERMDEIHTELTSLNKEANELMGEIMKSWEEMR